MAAADGRVRWGRQHDDSLLTQNSELRPDGIFNWTLPAWVVKLPNGRSFNVCPNAGACAALCYARSGTYQFRNVRAAHMRNLLFVLDRPVEWERRMVAELHHRRYAGRAVRVHDSGDFFSDDYLAAWLRIMRSAPHVLFYAYTKEVSRFRRLVEPDPPPNFRWVYSLGGREDALVDRDTDRHADVFPDEEAIAAAGYASQDASDLLAIGLPTNRIGIPANNIPHLRRQQGAATFGEIEASKRRAQRPDPARVNSSSVGPGILSSVKRHGEPLLDIALEGDARPGHRPRRRSLHR